MTQYLNRSFFEKEEPLDQGTLSSVVVESSAGIQDALLPLGLVSARTQNVATVLHVNGEGQVIRLNLVMSGKPWAKKMDAKRLFSGAPEGSKLVIQKLDVSGFEFPPGEHTSLWLSSTEFDWSVQKTNNRDQGSHTQDELEGFGIRDWSLRVHIEVNEDPSIATVRWVGVPIPVGELNSLPGDPKKVGYPSVALSNGEANMAGVPNIENQSATSVGIPFYPVMINEAAPSSSIVIPRDDDIINAMCEFWRSGNTVRNMRLDDWVNVTKGPGEPSSDRGIPVLTWPPAEPACARDEEADYSDPSEDGSFTEKPQEVPGSAKYAGFRPGLSYGMYSAKSFPGTETLSPRLKLALLRAANNSLAESTWRQYKTAERHLSRCQRKTGVRMSFPMGKKQILLHSFHARRQEGEGGNCLKDFIRYKDTTSHRGNN